MRPGSNRSVPKDQFVSLERRTEQFDRTCATFGEGFDEVGQQLIDEVGTAFGGPCPANEAPTREIKSAIVSGPSPAWCPHTSIVVVTSAM
jgi:hypothetical protein